MVGSGAEARAALREGSSPGYLQWRLGPVQHHPAWHGPGVEGTNLKWLLFLALVRDIENALGQNVDRCFTEQRSL